MATPGTFELLCADGRFITVPAGVFYFDGTMADPVDPAVLTVALQTPRVSGATAVLLTKETLAKLGAADRVRGRLTEIPAQLRDRYVLGTLAGELVDLDTWLSTTDFFGMSKHAEAAGLPASARVVLLDRNGLETQNNPSAVRVLPRAQAAARETLRAALEDAATPSWDRLVDLTARAATLRGDLGVPIRLRGDEQRESAGGAYALAAGIALFGVPDGADPAALMRKVRPIGADEVLRVWGGVAVPTDPAGLVTALAATPGAGALIRIDPAGADRPRLGWLVSRPDGLAWIDPELDGLGAIRSMPPQDAVALLRALPGANPATLWVDADGRPATAIDVPAGTGSDTAEPGRGPADPDTTTPDASRVNSFDSVSSTDTALTLPDVAPLDRPELGVEVTLGLSAEDIRQVLPWLPQINPKYRTDLTYEQNCVLTALALDMTLASAGDVRHLPVEAGGADGQLRIDLLEARFPGRRFEPADSLEQIQAAMTHGATGAAGRSLRKGIVVVRGAGETVSHAFNVASLGKDVAFIDGQTRGRARMPKDIAEIRFLPTSDGIPSVRPAVELPADTDPAVVEGPVETSAVRPEDDRAGMLIYPDAINPTVMYDDPAQVTSQDPLFAGLHPRQIARLQAIAADDMQAPVINDELFRRTRNVVIGAVDGLGADDARFFRELYQARGAFDAFDPAMQRRSMSRVLQRAEIAPGAVGAAASSITDFGYRVPYTEILIPHPGPWIYSTSPPNDLGSTLNHVMGHSSVAYVLTDNEPSGTQSELLEARINQINEQNAGRDGFIPLQVRIREPQLQWNVERNLYQTRLGGATFVMGHAAGYQLVEIRRARTAPPAAAAPQPQPVRQTYQQPQATYTTTSYSSAPAYYSTAYSTAPSSSGSYYGTSGNTGSSSWQYGQTGGYPYTSGVPGHYTQYYTVTDPYPGRRRAGAIGADADLATRPAGLDAASEALRFADIPLTADPVSPPDLSDAGQLAAAVSRVEAWSSAVEVPRERAGALSPEDCVERAWGAFIAVHRRTGNVPADADMVEMPTPEALASRLGGTMTPLDDPQGLWESMKAEPGSMAFVRTPPLSATGMSHVFVLMSTGDGEMRVLDSQRAGVSTVPAELAPAPVRVGDAAPDDHSTWLRAIGTSVLRLNPHGQAVDLRGARPATASVDAPTGRNKAGGSGLEVEFPTIIVFADGIPDGVRHGDPLVTHDSGLFHLVAEREDLYLGRDKQLYRTPEVARQHGQSSVRKVYRIIPEFVNAKVMRSAPGETAYVPPEAIYQLLRTVAARVEDASQNNRPLTEAFPAAQGFHVVSAARAAIVGPRPVGSESGARFQYNLAPDKSRLRKLLRHVQQNTWKPVSARHLADGLAFGDYLAARFLVRRELGNGWESTVPFGDAALAEAVGRDPHASQVSGYAALLYANAAAIAHGVIHDRYGKDNLASAGRNTMTFDFDELDDPVREYLSSNGDFIAGVFRDQVQRTIEEIDDRASSFLRDLGLRSKVFLADQPYKVGTYPGENEEAMRALYGGTAVTYLKGGLRSASENPFGDVVVDQYRALRIRPVPAPDRTNGEHALFVIEVRHYGKRLETVEDAIRNHQTLTGIASEIFYRGGPAEPGGPVTAPELLARLNADRIVFGSGQHELGEQSRAAVDDLVTRLADMAMFTGSPLDLHVEGGGRGGRGGSTQARETGEDRIQAVLDHLMPALRTALRERGVPEDRVTVRPSNRGSGDTRAPGAATTAGDDDRRAVFTWPRPAQRTETPGRTAAAMLDPALGRRAPGQVPNTETQAGDELLADPAESRRRQENPALTGDQLRTLWQDVVASGDRAAGSTGDRSLAECLALVQDLVHRLHPGDRLGHRVRLDRTREEPTPGRDAENWLGDREDWQRFGGWTDLSDRMDTDPALGARSMAVVLTERAGAPYGHVYAAYHAGDDGVLWINLTDRGATPRVGAPGELPRDADTYTRAIVIDPAGVVVGSAEPAPPASESRTAPLLDPPVSQGYRGGGVEAERTMPMVLPDGAVNDTVLASTVDGGIDLLSDHKLLYERDGTYHLAAEYEGEWTTSADIVELRTGVLGVLPGEENRIRDTDEFWEQLVDVEDRFENVDTEPGLPEENLAEVLEGSSLRMVPGIGDTVIGLPPEGDEGGNHVHLTFGSPTEQLKDFLADVTERTWRDSSVTYDTELGPVRYRTKAGQQEGAEFGAEVATHLTQFLGALGFATPGRVSGAVEGVLTQFYSHSAGYMDSWTPSRNITKAHVATLSRHDHRVLWGDLPWWTSFGLSLQADEIRDALGRLYLDRNGGFLDLMRRAGAKHPELAGITPENWAEYGSREKPNVGEYLEAALTGRAMPPQLVWGSTTTFPRLDTNDGRVKHGLAVAEVRSFGARRVTMTQTRDNFRHLAGGIRSRYAAIAGLDPLRTVPLQETGDAVTGSPVHAAMFRAVAHAAAGNTAESARQLTAAVQAGITVAQRDKWSSMLVLRAGMEHAAGNRDFAGRIWRIAAAIAQPVARRWLTEDRTGRWNAWAAVGDELVAGQRIDELGRLVNALERDAHGLRPELALPLLRETRAQRRSDALRAVLNAVTPEGFDLAHIVIRSVPGLSPAERRMAEATSLMLAGDTAGATALTVSSFAALTPVTAGLWAVPMHRLAADAGVPAVSRGLADGAVQAWLAASDPQRAYDEQQRLQEFSTSAGPEVAALITERLAALGQDAGAGPRARGFLAALELADLDAGTAPYEFLGTDDADARHEQLLGMLGDGPGSDSDSDVAMMDDRPEFGVRTVQSLWQLTQQVTDGGPRDVVVRNTLRAVVTVASGAPVNTLGGYAGMLLTHQAHIDDATVLLDALRGQNLDARVAGAVTAVENLARQVATSLSGPAAPGRTAEALVDAPLGQRRAGMYPNRGGSAARSRRRAAYPDGTVGVAADGSYVVAAPASPRNPRRARFDVFGPDGRPRGMMQALTRQGDDWSGAEELFNYSGVPGALDLTTLHLTARSQQPYFRSLMVSNTKVQHIRRESYRMTELAVPANANYQEFEQDRRTAHDIARARLEARGWTLPDRNGRLSRPAWTSTDPGWAPVDATTGEPLSVLTETLDGLVTRRVSGWFTDDGTFEVVHPGTGRVVRRLESWTGVDGVVRWTVAPLSAEETRHYDGLAARFGAASGADLVQSIVSQGISLRGDVELPGFSLYRLTIGSRFVQVRAMVDAGGRVVRALRPLAIDGDRFRANDYRMVRDLTEGGWAVRPGHQDRFSETGRRLELNPYHPGGRTALVQAHQAYQRAAGPSSAYGAMTDPYAGGRRSGAVDAGADVGVRPGGLDVAVEALQVAGVSPLEAPVTRPDLTEADGLAGAVDRVRRWTARVEVPAGTGVDPAGLPPEDCVERAWGVFIAAHRRSGNAATGADLVELATPEALAARLGGSLSSLPDPATFWRSIGDTSGSMVMVRTPPRAGGKSHVFWVMSFGDGVVTVWDSQRAGVSDHPIRLDSVPWVTGRGGAAFAELPAELDSVAEYLTWMRTPESSTLSLDGRGTAPHASPDLGTEQSQWTGDPSFDARAVEVPPSRVEVTPRTVLTAPLTADQFGALGEWARTRTGVTDPAYCEVLLGEVYHRLYAHPTSAFLDRRPASGTADDSVLTTGPLAGMGDWTSWPRLGGEAWATAWTVVRGARGRSVFARAGRPGAIGHAVVLHHAADGSVWVDNLTAGGERWRMTSPDDIRDLPTGLDVRAYVTEADGRRSTDARLVSEPEADSVARAITDPIDPRTAGAGVVGREKELPYLALWFPPDFVGDKLGTTLVRASTFRYIADEHDSDDYAYHIEEVGKPATPRTPGTHTVGFEAYLQESAAAQDLLRSLPTGGRTLQEIFGADPRFHVPANAAGVRVIPRLTPDPASTHFTSAADVTFNQFTADIRLSGIPQFFTWLRNNSTQGYAEIVRSQVAGSLIAARYAAAYPNASAKTLLKLEGVMAAMHLTGIALARSQATADLYANQGAGKLFVISVPRVRRFSLLRAALPQTVRNWLHTNRNRIITDFAAGEAFRLHGSPSPTQLLQMGAGTDTGVVDGLLAFLQSNPARDPRVSASLGVKTTLSALRPNSSDASDPYVPWELRNVGASGDTFREAPWGGRTSQFARATVGRPLMKDSRSVEWMRDVSRLSRTAGAPAGGGGLGNAGVREVGGNTYFQDDLGEWHRYHENGTWSWYGTQAPAEPAPVVQDDYDESYVEEMGSLSLLSSSSSSSSEPAGRSPGFYNGPTGIRYYYDGTAWYMILDNGTTVAISREPQIFRMDLGTSRAPAALNLASSLLGALPAAGMRTVLEALERRMPELRTAAAGERWEAFLQLAADLTPASVTDATLESTNIKAQTALGAYDFARLDFGDLPPVDRFVADLLPPPITASTVLAPPLTVPQFGQLADLARGRVSPDEPAYCELLLGEVHDRLYLHPTSAFRDRPVRSQAVDDSAVGRGALAAMGDWRSWPRLPGLAWDTVFDMLRAERGRSAFVRAGLPGRTGHAVFLHHAADGTIWVENLDRAGNRWQMRHRHDHGGLPSGLDTRAYLTEPDGRQITQISTATGPDGLLEPIAPVAESDSLARALTDPADPRTGAAGVVGREKEYPFLALEFPEDFTGDPVSTVLVSAGTFHLTGDSHFNDVYRYHIEEGSEPTTRQAAANPGLPTLDLYTEQSRAAQDLLRQVPAEGMTLQQIFGADPRFTVRPGAENVRVVPRLTPNPDPAAEFAHAADVTLNHFTPDIRLSDLTRYYSWLAANSVTGYQELTRALVRGSAFARDFQVAHPDAPEKEVRRVAGVAATAYLFALGMARANNPNNPPTSLPLPKRFLSTVVRVDPALLRGGGLSAAAQTFLHDHHQDFLGIFAGTEAPLLYGQHTPTGILGLGQPGAPTVRDMLLNFLHRNPPRIVSTRQTMGVNLVKGLLPNATDPNDPYVAAEARNVGQAGDSWRIPAYGGRAEDIRGAQEGDPGGTTVMTEPRAQEFMRMLAELSESDQAYGSGAGRSVHDGAEYFQDDLHRWHVNQNGVWSLHQDGATAPQGHEDFLGLTDDVGEMTLLSSSESDSDSEPARPRQEFRQTPSGFYFRDGDQWYVMTATGDYVESSAPDEPEAVARTSVEGLLDPPLGRRQSGMRTPPAAGDRTPRSLTGEMPPYTVGVAPDGSYVVARAPKGNENQPHGFTGFDVYGPDDLPRGAMEARTEEAGDYVATSSLQNHSDVPSALDLATFFATGVSGQPYFQSISVINEKVQGIREKDYGMTPMPNSTKGSRNYRQLRETTHAIARKRLESRGWTLPTEVFEVAQRLQPPWSSADPAWAPVTAGGPLDIVTETLDGGVTRRVSGRRDAQGMFQVVNPATGADMHVLRSSTAPDGTLRWTTEALSPTDLRYFTKVAREWGWTAASGLRERIKHKIQKRAGLRDDEAKAHDFVASIVTEDGRLRDDLVLPGFGLYRMEWNGRTILVRAMVDADGRVARVRRPLRIDEDQQRYRGHEYLTALRAAGWTIRTGHGSSMDATARVLVLDPYSGTAWRSLTEAYQAGPGRGSDAAPLTDPLLGQQRSGAISAISAISDGGVAGARPESLRITAEALRFADAPLTAPPVAAPDLTHADQRRAAADRVARWTAAVEIRTDAARSRVTPEDCVERAWGVFIAMHRRTGNVPGDADLVEHRTAEGLAQRLGGALSPFADATALETWLTERPGRMTLVRVPPADGGMAHVFWGISFDGSTVTWLDSQITGASAESFRPGAGTGENSAMVRRLGSSALLLDERGTVTPLPPALSAVSNPWPLASSTVPDAEAMTIPVPGRQRAGAGPSDGMFGSATRSFPGMRRGGPSQDPYLMAVSGHPNDEVMEVPGSEETDPLPALARMWREIDDAWRSHRRERSATARAALVEDIQERTADLRVAARDAATFLTAPSRSLQRGQRHRERALADLDRHIDRLEQRGDRANQVAAARAYRGLLDAQLNMIRHELTNRAVHRATQDMVAGARDLRLVELLRQAPADTTAEVQAERAAVEAAIRNVPASARVAADVLRQRLATIDADMALYNSLRDRTDWNALNDAPATALILATRRGREFASRERTAAIQRFEGVGWDWLRGYPRTGSSAFRSILDRAHDYMAANYVVVTMRNLGRVVRPGETILDELLSGPDARIQNLWELGRDNDSANFAIRGATEERLGYAATVRRDPTTGGTFQTYRADRDLDVFAPTDEGRRDLPKYAGFVSPLRVAGLGAYGSAAFFWNQAIRGRSTVTPRDSFTPGLGGTGGYSSMQDLYPLLAYGDEDVVRLLLAEATGFVHDPEMRENVERGDVARGRTVTGYFEAQIHGDLGWPDLERVVVNPALMLRMSPEAAREETARQTARLRDFARRHGFGFGVEVFRPAGASPERSAAGPSTRPPVTTPRQGGSRRSSSVSARRPSTSSRPVSLHGGANAPDTGETRSLRDRFILPEDRRSSRSSWEHHQIWRVKAVQKLPDELRMLGGGSTQERIDRLVEQVFQAEPRISEVLERFPSSPAAKSWQEALQGLDKLTGTPESGVVTEVVRSFVRAAADVIRIDRTATVALSKLSLGLPAPARDVAAPRGFGDWTVSDLPAMTAGLKRPVLTADLSGTTSHALDQLDTALHEHEWWGEVPIVVASMGTQPNAERLEVLRERFRPVVIQQSMTSDFQISWKLIGQDGGTVAETELNRTLFEGASALPATPHGTALPPVLAGLLTAGRGAAAFHRDNEQQLKDPGVRDALETLIAGLPEGTPLAARVRGAGVALALDGASTARPAPAATRPLDPEPAYTGGPVPASFAHDYMAQTGTRKERFAMDGLLFQMVMAGALRPDQAVTLMRAAEHNGGDRAAATAFEVLFEVLSLPETVANADPETDPRLTEIFGRLRKVTDTTRRAGEAPPECVEPDDRVAFVPRGDATRDWLIANGRPAAAALVEVFTHKIGNC
ncbi:hypothetical protein J2S43_004640 [Catenuloplanes nepalensis]|uniref:Uncharacterized protein n=1 Tax=Catenuloplanes nepalensis TaxID=587533 RepID=A0ABT9MY02_9ACTN|nr:hypothetical protein [Catenuloplanes nepalensis]MDP9796128.1 hypothetical protein [Catenuloplanes nepalensis]